MNEKVIELLERLKASTTVLKVIRHNYVSDEVKYNGLYDGLQIALSLLTGESFIPIILEKDELIMLGIEELVTSNRKED